MRATAFMVLLLLILVPGSGAGLRTSDFEENARSVEVLSPGNLSIKVPADAHVLRAVMDVCPMPVDGQNPVLPFDPVLRIDDTVVWAFNGTGYGQFGRQDLFSDGSAERTFSFGAEGGRSEACIRLPKAAVVEEASMDVECTGESWGLADTPLVGPGVNASFGYSIARAGDVNRDGYDDFLIGAPFYSLPGKENVGMARLYLGGPGPIGGPALVIVGNESGERLGFSVSGGGDFNGDGYDDFVVGAPGGYYESGGEGAYRPGMVQFYFGNSSVDGVPDIVLNGLGEYRGFGYSVSIKGDVNGDGFDDVLVCSPYDYFGNGMLYVFLGSAIPDGGYDSYVRNSPHNINMLTVEGAGDVNSDGCDDFLVMFMEMEGQGRCGQVVPEYYYRAALCFGGFNLYNGVIFSYEKDDPAYSFAGAGDLNGDRYDDLILGGVWDQRFTASAGLASVYLGGPGIDTAADIVIPPGDLAGGKVLEAAAAGDVNGDGYDDAILGVGFGPLTEPSAPGVACVYYGGNRVDTVPDLIFHGTDPMEFFGGVVASAGDVNADGRDEVLVAAAGDDFGGRDSGTVHLYSLGNGISEPRLEIGNASFWEPKGLSSAGGISLYFTSELAAYLKNAPVSGSDRFGNEYIDVPISVGARGRGNLTLSNLRIRYNCTATVADFSAAANMYLDSHRMGCSAEQTISINAECSTPARFCISNLDLKYGLPPSILQPIPDVVIDEESSNYQLLDLWEYFQDDVDPVQNLEFKVLYATNSDAVDVEVVLNRYLSAEARTGRASVNWTGEVRVVVGCSDMNGILRESNWFTLLVRNVQDPPVITSVPPTHASYGEEYTYQVVAMDADGDALHYSLIGAPEGMAIDPDTGDIGWYPLSRGKYEVQVKVTDGIDCAIQDFSIDVWKNTPPLILSEPPVKVPAGAQYTYDFIAWDAEEDQLTFCLLTIAPGMTIDPSTGQLLWTTRQDQSGYYPVAIIASDGLGGTAEQSFMVEVQDSLPTCSIMHPADGAVVKDTRLFRGEAAGGAVPVARVEVRLDSGKWFTANGTDRWYCAIDTSLLGDGLHTLQVRAFNGVYSEEAQMSFIVKNRQSPAPEEVRSGGVAILPLVLVLTLIAAGVVIWRKGSAGSRAGRS